MTFGYEFVQLLISMTHACTCLLNWWCGEGNLEGMAQGQNGHTSKYNCCYVHAILFNSAVYIVGR